MQLDFSIIKFLNKELKKYDIPYDRRFFIAQLLIEYGEERNHILSMKVDGLDKKIKILLSQINQIYAAFAEVKGVNRIFLTLSASQSSIGLMTRVIEYVAEKIDVNKKYDHMLLTENLSNVCSYSKAEKLISYIGKVKEIYLSIVRGRNL